MRPRRNVLARVAIGAALVIAAIVTAIVVILTGGCGWGGDKDSKDNQTSTVIQGTGQTADTCWEVHRLPHQSGRFVAPGVPQKYRTTTQETTFYFLNVAKRDPQVLQGLWYGTPEGRRHPIRDWRKLVDTSGSCYSRYGQAMWNRLYIVLTTTPKRVANAPRYGCNGVIPGNNAQATCRVMYIGGNRRGVMYMFKNGSKIVYMYRCGGQPVTPGRPPRVAPTPRPGPRPHGPSPKGPKKPPPVTPPTTTTTPKSPPPVTTTTPKPPPPVTTTTPKTGTLGPGAGTPGPGSGTGTGGDPGPGQGPMCRNSSGDLVPGNANSDGNCPGATPPTTGGSSPAGPPAPAPQKCIDPNTMQERTGPADQYGYCT